MIRWAAGLHPHPGLAAGLTTRLFQHLHTCFITVDDPTVQQAFAHQIQQRLKVLAALNHPACQGLARDIDTVTPQHFFEAVKRQAVCVFGGQQHGQHTRAGHAFLDHLGGLVRRHGR